MLIKRKDILTSPGFVISVSLLLVNDFFLKPALNNTFTGKLTEPMFDAVFARARELVAQAAHEP